MERKKSFIIENIIKLCIAIVILIFMVIFINSAQNGISRKRQYTDSMDILLDISNTLDSNEATAEALTEAYHDGNRQILNDLKMLMQSDSAANVFDKAENASSDKLDGLIGKNFAPYLFLTDEKGNVIISVDKEYTGLNLCDIGFFTEDQFSELITCPINGIVCTPEQELDDYCFYAETDELYSEKCYLIIGNDNNAFQKRIDSLTNLGSIVKNVSLGDGEIIFAVETKNGTISYCSQDDMNLSGKTIEEAGITQELLSNNASDTIKINGKEYFCTALCHSDDMVLIQAVSTAVLYSDNYKPTAWALGLLIMILVVAIHYEMFLPGSLAKRKKKQRIVSVFRTRCVINLTAVSKAVPLLVLGLVLIFGCVFYAHTIMKLSWAINDVERPLNQLNEELTENEKEKESIQDYCNQMYLSKAQMVANMLEIDPSCLNEETSKVYIEYTDEGDKIQLSDSEGNPMYSVANSSSLQQLCESNDIQSIQIFNDLGYVIAASNDSWYFHLSHDPEDQSNAFYDVVDGKKDYLVQDAQVDDDGNTNQYIGVVFHYYTTKDDGGKTLYVSRLDYQDYLNGKEYKNPVTEHQSLLQCSVDMTTAQNMMQSLDVNYIMEHVSLTNDAYMVVFDNSPDHTIVYTPNKQNLGKTASELEVSDAEFSGTFNGFQTVQGVKYFECCRYDNGYYVAVAMPLSSLYAARFSVTFNISLTCLIVMILIMAIFSITLQDDMDWLRNKPGKDDGQNKEITAEKKTSYGLRKVLSKWGGRFSQKNAEEKITIMIRIFAMIIGIYLILGLLFEGTFFINSSLIDYVFSDSWERGVNIFAFTKSFVLLITVIVAVEMVSWFVKMAFSVFNSNAVTIAHLLMSFVKYGSVIGVFFYCLYLFGMQPASLLASAGVITLVIGLGAQSLIGDMLASIFIIFEHSFLVGDFVSINGKYGLIKEIGIRTTRIQDLNNNIMVCNNSEIKNVTNLSVKVTVIRIILSISYEESLEHVEEVLNKELPLLRDKYPQIIDGPTYDGVYELNTSSVDLRISVRCNGKDYTKVNMGMNRELLLICERNNINIPYQHITIVQDEEK